MPQATTKSLLASSLLIAASAWPTTQATGQSVPGIAVPAAAVAEFNQRSAWQQSYEPAAYRAFSAKFVAAFNADRLAEIGACESPGMLEKLPAEKLIGFLKSLRSDNGKIQSLAFKYFDKRDERNPGGPVAAYRLRFENGSYWTFRTALDDQGRMTRLIVSDPNFNEDLPLTAAKTRLQLPFARSEQWYVLWGGDSEEQNYHVISRSQKNAFDLLILHPWSRRSYRTDGSRNEDYYAFGRPIFSPLAGVVTKVIEGVADNVPGKMNPQQLTGNTVVIRSNQGEYVLLAHLQKGSIKVRRGDRVSAGALLGKCGNSGNSSEPHLHLQVMDGPDMASATGLKAHFSTMVLNGESPVANYSPVRGNVIQRP